jgi:hypothetical protein
MMIRGASAGPLARACHYDNNGMADLVLCVTIGEKHRKTQL